MVDLDMDLRKNQSSKKPTCPLTFQLALLSLVEGASIRKNFRELSLSNFDVETSNLFNSRY